jgi:hypothetical protein
MTRPRHASRAGRLVGQTPLADCASSPYHPQTCGEVERFHQTLKRHLARRPPAADLAMLQRQLDAYRAYYNGERPIGRSTGRPPASIFETRIKTRPVREAAPTWFRVRQDRVSEAGNVTVRYLSRLRHIGIGEAHSGREVRLLFADDRVRVVAEDGWLLRELVLDADRDYQPRLRSSTTS